MIPSSPFVRVESRATFAALAAIEGSRLCDLCLHEGHCVHSCKKPVTDRQRVDRLETQKNGKYVDHVRQEKTDSRHDEQPIDDVSDALHVHSPTKHNAKHTTTIAPKDSQTAISSSLMSSLR